MHKKLLPILRNLFSRDQNKIALGRWSLVQDDKLHRRSDLSNEDHCGPCGEYVLQKRRDHDEGFGKKEKQVATQQSNATKQRNTKKI